MHGLLLNSLPTHLLQRREKDTVSLVVGCSLEFLPPDRASTSVCLEISFDLAVRFGFLIFYPSSIIWSAVILCRYCLWCILGFQYDITYCIASFRKMFKGRHWNLRYYVFILINIFLEYVSWPRAGSSTRRLRAPVIVHNDFAKERKKKKKFASTLLWETLNPMGNQP